MATLPGERLIAPELQPLPEIFDRVLSMPAGTIGILADSTARYTHFWLSVRSTLMPPGTLFHDAVGTTVVYGWNQIAETLLRREERRAGAWLWMLGDDHVWAPDLLAKLIEHDRDIIVPTVVQKVPPFEPVLYSDRLANGRYRQLVLEEHPAGGLIKVAAAGTAGMLIKRRVFEALDPPWFQFGKLSPEETGEDVYFCQRATEAGFDVWADLDLAMGHTTTATLYAKRMGDAWGVDLETAQQVVGHMKRIPDA